MTFSIIGSKDIISIATGGVLVSKLTGTGSNQLLASPAFILAQYIIDVLETMTVPTDDAVWPLYVNHLPDKVSNAGAIHDTTGLKDGRYMIGFVPQKFGVQLMLRALDNQIGYAKIEDVAAGLDTIINAELSLDSGDYVIQNASRTSPIIPLGIEEGTRRRFLYTINFLLTMRRV